MDSDAIDALKDQVSALPLSAGCYIYLDHSGHEIYVGKAKSLRKRVQSYFVSSAKHNARTRQLVSEVRSLRYIETDSEVEALLLENTLIKQLQPRFNVRLKDDKGYPLIAISREPFPRVYITRRSNLPNHDLIGPFISKTSLDEAYQFLMRVFQFRNCKLDISLTIKSVDILSLV